MPTNTSITSNYVGKAAGELIGASYKEMDTIQKGAVTFLQNVNHDTFLRKIAYTDGRQAYSCGFTPAGAVTLTERTLSPVKIKNDLQVCKEDFRTQWSGDLIGASAANPMLPSDIRAAILTEMLGENAEENDRVIWQGNSTNPDEWDGFITLFEADAAIIKDGNGITAPGTATVGKTTVLAGFELVTSAAPPQIRNKSDFVLAASSDVVLSLYQLLISNATSNGLGLTPGGGLQYGKWPIVEIAGLPDGVLLGYRKSNLVFGTGLLGDHNNIAVVDEDEIGLLTGQVRMKMVFNGGCQYYNSAEIVYLDYSD